MIKANKNKLPSRLPKTFPGLLRLMPPTAIRDDLQHKLAVEIIDRLMQIDDLTSGQSRYMKALFDSVEAYEDKYHSIDLPKCDNWTPGFFERLEKNGPELAATVDEMLRQIHRSRS